MCPASNSVSSCGTAATHGSASPTAPRENQVRQQRGEEGGGQGTTESKAPSLLLSPHRAGPREEHTIPPSLSHTSSLFPFLRCLSLSHSSTNTDKTAASIFFSPFQTPPSYLIHSQISLLQIPTVL